MKCHKPVFEIHELKALHNIDPDEDALHISEADQIPGQNEQDILEELFEQRWQPE
uniref:Uncharacterized protein n=1 Tax=Rhizophora mucronata TaxID=61149 RepID=A0A2P2IM89_RHIMU